MPRRPVAFAEDSLPGAAQVVRAGGLIVYPTDTVYGLGCDPNNEAALDRLFAAKKRESKPIPLICDSLETASKLVHLTSTASELAREYWPGALTIVAPAAAKMPYKVHQGSGSLGVRVPGSALCRKLAAVCGGVLTGTSANVSGGKPARTAEQAEIALGRSVDLILDGGRLSRAESTVVRVTEGGIEVLRQGAVRVKEKDIGP